MLKTKYTLQDWYLVKTGSKYADGNCETCGCLSKPEQIKWSFFTNNFSCKSCIKQREELEEIKLRRMMQMK